QMKELEVKPSIISKITKQIVQKQQQTQEFAKEEDKGNVFNFTTPVTILKETEIYQLQAEITISEYDDWEINNNF
ncbi:4711_t:CDS:1, partial [Funneliformis caledonium]